MLFLPNGKDDKMANLYGYARVSSADQNEARQVVALTGAGIERGKIFIDHKSGKDFNRPAWRRIRRTLRAGDTLVIQSLDRLGRNYADMLDEWRYLVHKRKANIRFSTRPTKPTVLSARSLLKSSCNFSRSSPKTKDAASANANDRESRRHGPEAFVSVAQSENCRPSSPSA